MTDSSTHHTEIRIGIIAGTTRPGRRSLQVARWVRDIAATHLKGRATANIVDLADFDLPLLDEPVPAAIGSYERTHTRRWSETVASYDGFVFVTSEYNHSMPAAVKNAIDFLFSEWNNKAAGFVSYGLNGGVRAVDHLRLTLGEAKVASVRSQVALNLFTDFDLPDILEAGEVTPQAHHAEVLTRMLDELVDWSHALRPLRTGCTS